MSCSYFTKCDIGILNLSTIEIGKYIIYYMQKSKRKN